MYEFKYNCVSPTNYDELETIIDDLNDDISYDEFAKLIPFEDANNVLGGVYINEQQMRKDWAIRFYVGSVEFDDEVIEYACIVWSAIEFVFKR